MSFQPHINWPAARQFAEAMQTPALCFTDPILRSSEAAFDRLGMPLVTSGQFAFVFKLKSPHGNFAVRCFRGFAKDRAERYQSIHQHLREHPIPAIGSFAYHPEGILVCGRA